MNWNVDFSLPWIQLFNLFLLCALLVSRRTEAQSGKWKSRNVSRFHLLPACAVSFSRKIYRFFILSFNYNVFNKKNCIFTFFSVLLCFKIESKNKLLWIINNFYFQKKLIQTYKCFQIINSYLKPYGIWCVGKLLFFLYFNSIWINF